MTTHQEAEHGEPLSFWRQYIFSVDHKMIAKQYLILGLVMALIGGLTAYLIRTQLAWPEKPLPVIGVSKTYQEEGEVATARDKMWEKWFEDDKESWFETNMPTGVIEPSFYNALVTMHGTIMVFFVAMPILLGAFGNFLIPLMIGAPDMAFPRLNMMSFWTIFLGSLLIVVSFFVPGGAASAGWTGYAPLSAVADYTGVEWGMNLWILGLALEFVSVLMGGINFLTTAIAMRAPGMTLFRMPLMVWMQLTAAVLFMLSVV